jgi:two-component system OmpR family response regulator
MTNARSRNAVSGSPGLPLRVFIADDSAPIAEMLTELLTAPGRVEVIGVGDSEASAIEAITRLKPDAVVLDMQLKTGSGTNVIRAVRANAQLESMRVIVMSNHASPQLKAGCLELGADDYLDKVKDLGLLTQRIDELVERKEKEGL